MNKTCDNSARCTSDAHWLSCPLWVSEGEIENEPFDEFDEQPTVGRYYVEDFETERRKDRSR